MLRAIPGEPAVPASSMPRRRLLSRLSSSLPPPPVGTLDVAALLSGSSYPWGGGRLSDGYLPLLAHSRAAVLHRPEPGLIGVCESFSLPRNSQAPRSQAGSWQGTEARATLWPGESGWGSLGSLIWLQTEGTGCRQEALRPLPHPLGYRELRAPTSQGQGPGREIQGHADPRGRRCGSRSWLSQGGRLCVCLGHIRHWPVLG